jgi:CBS domain-containing protein
MICPSCGHVNLPGNEECDNCKQDLTPLDRPTASNQVERSLMEDSVAVLRPKKPVTIRPTTPLQSVIQAMLASDVGALLVTGDDGKLVGILSERDLLKKVVGVRDGYGQLPAGEFMTSNPETVSSSDTLNFALHKMDCGGYRHMPVLTDGKPSGVISVRDIMRHIVRLCKGH